MPKTLGEIALALAVIAALDAAAAPAPSGLYKSSELGILELTTDSGRVSGKYQQGGGCDFEGDQQIIEGQLEGNMLVGTVMLCQTGASCAQRVYPLLAFVDSAEQVIFGDVKLDAGCSSPALAGTRLTLAPAPASPSSVRPDPGNDPGPAPVGGGSAALIARKKIDPKKNTELHRSALLQGKRLLESGDFGGAAQQFEVGISYNENNWAAYFGLGVAEFKRGNVLKAIDSYERARDLAKQARQDNPDVYYNLACAHSRLGDKRAALTNLRNAIKLGFSLPEAMTADADLNKLLADDPEFKKLVDQAMTLKTKNRKGHRKP
jgi:hypothetical protein